MDEHDHVPIDLYLEVGQRKRPAADLARAVVGAARRMFPGLGGHLDRAEALRERRRSRREGEATHGGATPGPAPADLNRRLEAERPAAARDLKRLMALRPARRLAALEASAGRFRSPVLAESLIEESRKIVRLDPREAQSLAEVAEKVALRIRAKVWGAPEPTRLALRAAAHRANALRVAGDLPQADAIWAAIHARQRGVPPVGGEVEGELLSLEASLRQDQRRLDEADRLLVRAVAIFKSATESDGLAKAFLKRGNVADLGGDGAAALERYKEALAALLPGAPRQLELMIHNNLAITFCNLGDFAAAKGIVERHRALYAECADRWVLLRLTWLEGQIALGLGDTDAAERHFRRARAGYLADGNGFNAALVALDLAELYLGTGQPVEAKRLAEAMQGEFVARDAHSEAVRALRVFQEAARAQHLDTSFIACLRTYLQSARHDPNLVFEPAF